jgi:hypothetical protein
MRIPTRRPVTSIKKTEELKKVLEPYYGKKSNFAGADWGPGWNDIIFDVHDKLVKESPNYVILQIKEKFSTLRYYADGVSEDGRAYIQEAEHKSAVTCEECGRPGKLRNGSWIRTLCDWDHNVEKINTYLWKYQRGFYLYYWRVRFAITRKLKERK